MEVEDLPFRAEYAKSGRASCRSCKSGIGKDTLRLAVMVQSPAFDGKVPHWYHMMCFFGKQRPKTIGDIAHFESLRYEDQQEIKAKIGSLESVVLPQKKGKKRAEPGGAGTSGNAALKDYTIEYAKSGRAACRGCEQKILKDEVRVAKKDFETEVGKRYGGQQMWHHLDCFAKLRSELKYFETGEKLPGFKSLKVDDQKNVKVQLPAIKQEEIPIKKPKLEDETTDKADEALEKEIKEQSKIIFKYRDQLKDQLNKNELQSLLEHNKQEVPSGIERMLDRLSDLMTFGALERCAVCKNGQLVFDKEGYVCQGDLTEWTKCQELTKEPKRKPFKVPNDLKEYAFLKKYKYTPRTRAIRFVASSGANVKVKKDDEVDSKPKVERARPALSDMLFLLTGFKQKQKSALTKEIVKLGGKVIREFSEGNPMAVITPADQMDIKNYHIQSAKTQDIQVVSEDFVTEAKDNVGKIPELIIKKNLSSWGSDPATRLPAAPSVSKSKSKSIFTSSVPSKVTMRVKGSGPPVDSESGLGDVAHVYQEDKDKYNAILSLTDLQKQKNSYYKIQLLEADNKKKYWVYRSWGRISTTIGGIKVEEMNTLKQAKDHFKALYEEKTGNMWTNRHNFVKIPDRFYPVEVDYDQDEDDSLKIDVNDVSSDLEQPVQDLIKLIFDVDSMKKVMKEFELDLEKMPLGKLSKKQIQSAFSVLSELQTLVNIGGSDRNFIDASNRFYTFIPHSFGIENPPILNTAEMIKEKLDMLDSLMELEIAYNLMKGSHTAGGGNTIDGHYKQLKTELEVLPKDSEQFNLIKEYVKNTHAATHSHYGLEVEEVFTVKRHGEEKRYKPFRKLPNRKLLWHGSRTTNFAGILSQGLRIAPPEAPVTGYMFGKGIYFADMVSKSANYCFTNSLDNTGLMLLCEVALGEMYERTGADYIEKLPKGKHSCKGIGMTHPDPDKSVMKDGVEIPLGNGVECKVKSSLLYNEYIVYDIAQVNVKYLLKMNFNYKY
ncbi:Poly-(ADP-ribose) polymerase [Carabus blaptoides fortunei]